MVFFEPGLLRHALGGTARGSREQDPHTFGGEDAQDAIQRAGLAHTRSACDHGNL